MIQNILITFLQQVFQSKRKGATLIELFVVGFRFRIVALHSSLSSKDQAAAFTVPPAGVRKVHLNSSSVYRVNNNNN